MRPRNTVAGRPWCSMTTPDPEAPASPSVGDHDHPPPPVGSGSIQLDEWNFAVTHRVVAIALFVAVVLTAAGCEGAGSADQDELIAGFDDAVEAVVVTDVDGPNETTSKDLTYITGSGLTEGDVETALERALSGLRAIGMEVGDPTPVEQGAVVAAHDDTIAVQIGLYPRAGVNEAPEGMSIVQISVASADAGLAWTPE
jgi:hypothetical protein